MAGACICHVFVLIVQVVTLILLMVSCIASTCDYVNVKQDGVLFNSTRKWIVHTKGLQQCLKECSAMTSCLSVNFKKTTLECTLNTESATSASSNTDPAPGMVYLERSQWEQAIAGQCENIACPSNSKCIVLNSGQTTCVVIECPEPDEYHNAYITTPEISRRCGSTLQYACPTGYAWVGGSVTCSASGSWQGESQIEGCLALAPGSNCASDTTCSPVVSAKCKSNVCVCPAGFSYLSASSVCTRDCKSIFNSGIQTDGVYEIKPDGVNSVNTLCDMQNGGWTIFERRFVGDVDFMLEWEVYRQSFGSPSGDFWLGLDYLHALTVADSDIYFDFTTSADQPFYATYHNFSVADNSSLFKITMSSNFEITSEYSNIRNGGFYDHNNMYFSTPLQDNDISTTTNCASTRGAWWWNKCYTFGLFLQSFGSMKMFMGYNNTYVYFKETTMKVRRTK